MKTWKEIQNLLSLVKGKGKGKGAFNGNCNWCGKEGHRPRECKEFDKVMEARRAQGKGGGKDSGNKGGWKGGGNNNWRGNKGGGKGGWKDGKRG